MYDDTSLKTNGDSKRNLDVPKLQKYENIYIRSKETMPTTNQTIKIKYMMLENKDSN
jgi:hypothetical protein